MGKKVLFIAPPYMGLYKDIIEEMEKQGYDVTYIKEVVRPEDPDNVRGYKGLKKFFLVNRARFTKKNDRYWADILNTQAKDVYDILFVLNGQSLSPCIFKTLKERNPQIFCTNFMFDTTKGVYRFDMNFKYFDKVASFDLEDVQKHNLYLLPIFWIPQIKCKAEYVFFGMGAYKKDRYQFFSKVSQIAKNNHLKSYIRLYNPVKKRLWIKSVIRKIFGIQKDMISYEEYKSDIITNSLMPLSEFNLLMKKSSVVIDTNAPHQDGLTSRFMQALGNMQKIITTNKSVKSYKFYSEEQIFVIDDINDINEDQLIAFVQTNMTVPSEVSFEIGKTRIDNWVKYLLDIPL